MAGMARRDFGSVRKRGKRWQARWEDATGFQHSESFARKIEADEWLREQAHARAVHTWTDPRRGRVPLRTWQATWRENVVLRPSTKQRDFGYLDRYVLKDPIADTALGDLDWLTLSAWVTRLTDRGLAPATVVKAAQILGKVLKAAVQAQMIPANPMAGVALPKIEEEDVRILTLEEVGRLSLNMHERFSGLVPFGAYTGPRIGELLALRSTSLDVTQRKLRITENVSEAGKVSLWPPKTSAGRRTVPVASEALRAVSDRVGASAGLLWPNTRGGVMSPNNFRERYWRPAAEKAGLGDDVTPHTLRHTAVSLWIAAGATPKEVAVWAGHESVATVLDRYGHLWEGRESVVLESLDAMGA